MDDVPVEPQIQFFLGALFGAFGHDPAALALILRRVAAAAEKLAREVEEQRKPAGFE